MIPVFILQVWLLGLFSLGLIGGAVYFGRECYQRSWGWDEARRQSVFLPDFGMNQETLLLGGAVVLALLALAGGPIIKAILKLTRREKPAGEPGPQDTPRSVSKQRLHRPDGSELQVKSYGPEAGVPIICTHGWGLNSDEWNYLKQELSERFRLIVWDLPGLGESTRPANRDYSTEKFARDLEAVLELAGGKPAILLGHSIGGMTVLTFCRLFPEALGNRVAGLVLTHTTYTNPVRTTAGAAFLTAIEKPVLVPLMWLTIALSPLVRLMTWLSYRNGSLHLMTKRSSFGRTETWEQIEFATQFQPKASPAVLARGMLGMMRYDATEVLARINVPTLVVAGDKDSTTKPEASERIRAGIPHSRLVTLTPAKHMGLIEHHEKYAEAVREFVYAAQAQMPGTAAL